MILLNNKQVIEIIGGATSAVKAPVICGPVKVPDFSQP